ncbi:hypothetical protein [Saccharothrix variisporea]|uniref:hypothetical protein n=1 Tax=Saccharothrix variisporea TaxID=543527 RepID=UPI0011C40F46|nr:hypothetical protein [Saccharothrix variisporea]
MTIAFIPDPDGQPVRPNAGYLRVLLAEGALARSRTWGNDHFPVLHGGVSLNALGAAPITFTSFSRAPEEWTTPGVVLDHPLTMLLPFTGGTVEIEAALYQATADGPLKTAVDLVGNLASLMGPPLSFASQIADKVSTGLDQVLDATGNQPVLGLHMTMVSPGGGGRVLRPGHLVVVNTPPAALNGSTLVIHDGRLHLRDGDNVRLPEGVDYLVVRVECRAERDDWRFPELDDLIRAAGQAWIEGFEDMYRARRTEALVRAWNSTDLTPVDRRRVALLVREELDAVRELGAVAATTGTLGDIAPHRLRATDDDAVHKLDLAQLLA